MNFITGWIIADPLSFILVAISVVLIFDIVHESKCLYQLFYGEQNNATVPEEKYTECPNCNVPRYRNIDHNCHVEETMQASEESVSITADKVCGQMIDNLKHNVSEFKKRSNGY